MPIAATGDGGDYMHEAEVEEHEQHLNLPPEILRAIQEVPAATYVVAYPLNFLVWYLLEL